MCSVARGTALILIAALLWSASPLRAQPAAACPLSDAVPPRVTIGHFAEVAADVAEFCRYLVRNRMWPEFQNLGSIRDPGIAQRVHDALEAGSIDVLWLSTPTVALLAANSSIRLKALAMTDFVVTHVVSRDRRATSVMEPAFNPTAAMVPSGRSAMYADLLFAAVPRLKLQCLELPIACFVRQESGEELVGQFVPFLSDQPSRTVVLAAPAFRPDGPDPMVRRLLNNPVELQLVGVPAPTVVMMQSDPGTKRVIRGMLSATSIPKGYYRLDGRSEVPGADVPAAAAAMMLVSSTPPEVAARVQELVGRINDALILRDPRMSPGHLMESLKMAQALGESLGNQFILHDEYARYLQAQGLMAPPAPPRPAPAPTPTPTPPPTSQPPVIIIPFPFPFPPNPPQGSGGGAVIRQFTVTSVMSATAAARVRSAWRVCWAVVNAQRVRIDPGVGELAPGEMTGGCRQIPPIQTSSFRLTAWSQDGRSVSQVTMAR